MKKIKKRKQLSNEEINNLDIFIQDEASSKKEVCRAQAILFLNDGYDSSTIKRFTSFNTHYAYELTHRFKKMGVSSLTDKRKRKPKLSFTNKTRRKHVPQFLTLQITLVCFWGCYYALSQT